MYTKSRNQYFHIMQNLSQRGAQMIILGCTENRFIGVYKR